MASPLLSPRLSTLRCLSYASTCTMLLVSCCVIPKGCIAGKSWWLRSAACDCMHFKATCPASHAQMAVCMQMIIITAFVTPQAKFYVSYLVAYDTCLRPQSCVSQLCLVFSLNVFASQSIVNTPGIAQVQFRHGYTLSIYCSTMYASY